MRRLAVFLLAWPLVANAALPEAKIRGEKSITVLQGPTFILDARDSVSDEDLVWEFDKDIKYELLTPTAVKKGSILAVKGDLPPGTHRFAVKASEKPQGGIQRSDRAYVEVTVLANSGTAPMPQHGEGMPQNLAAQGKVLVAVHPSSQCATETPQGSAPPSKRSAGESGFGKHERLALNSCITKHELELTKHRDEAIRAQAEVDAQLNRMADEVTQWGQEHSKLNTALRGADLDEVLRTAQLDGLLDLENIEANAAAGKKWTQAKQSLASRLVEHLSKARAASCKFREARKQYSQVQAMIDEAKFELQLRDMFSSIRGMVQR